jgi:hypothetical protein
VVDDLIIGGVYQHWKGKNYLVRDLARHSETMEWLVVYECLYVNPEGQIWVRPLSLFLQKFTYIGDQKGKTRL